MPNFLIVASRDDVGPLTEIVSAEAAGDAITRLEGYGYELTVHKISAPITKEALAELRKGR
jgi:hypothetical protein